MADVCASANAGMCRNVALSCSSETAGHVSTQFASAHTKGAGHGRVRHDTSPATSNIHLAPGARYHLQYAPAHYAAALLLQVLC
jgi:hypothetical protein